MENNTLILLICLIVALPAGWYAAALWAWFESHRGGRHGR